MDPAIWCKFDLRADPAQLVPHPRNPNTHSQEQERLAIKVIGTNGWRAPIVVSKLSGCITRGHLRWRAAVAAGWEQVPVDTQDYADEAAELADMVADNRLAALAIMDEALILADLDAIRAMAPDFDTEVMGYTAGALAALEAQASLADYQKPVASGRLAEAWGAPPFSVLDARQGYWRARKAIWLRLGIDPTAGLEHVSDSSAQTTWMQRGRPVGGSAFDPVLAELAMRWWCVPGGRILDPFAGEVTKGAVAGFLGYQYVGVDVRGEQVTSNASEWQKIGRGKGVDPVWITGDSTHLSRVLPGDVEPFDMVLTSPPYWNLEEYRGGLRDGSNLGSFETFMAWQLEVWGGATACLRPNRFVVVKVGEVRGPDQGYVDFVGATVEAFRRLGLLYYVEAVLVTPTGSLPVRAGRAFAASRKLAKAHQNVLVFYKGDPAAIGETYPQEVECVTELPDEDAEGEAD